MNSTNQSSNQEPKIKNPPFTDNGEGNHNERSMKDKPEETIATQQSAVSGVQAQGDIKIGNISQSIQQEYNSYTQGSSYFFQRRDLSQFEYPYFPEFEL